ncbi:c-type cytochrome domain-containing protein [Prosthecobacter sp.]|uniref:c-type cytochrome domain-containing protein n=1 Tax=Prosthecobacter sp. TaxID=1965333 RepID=UPI0037834E64
MFSPRTLLPLLALAPAFLGAAEKIDFNKQIKPLLEGACTHCHGEKEDKGDFRMHTLEDIKKGNENGPASRLRRFEEERHLHHAAARCR